MRVVYVGDNRVRGNFGCRATSTALSQLISENHTIVGRITGKYNMWNPGDIFCVKGLPKWCYSFLSKLPHWQGIKKIWFTKISKRLDYQYYMSRFDFVDTNPKRCRQFLLDCLVANKHLDEFDLRKFEFDALVINGEGSFIFASPPWREALIIAMLMDWAQEMGKKVFFLNAMFSDDPFSPHNSYTISEEKNVFNACNMISVREQFSHDFYLKYFDNAPKNLYCFPDALFTWYDLINDSEQITSGKYILPPSLADDASFTKFDFSKPYICIAGSSAGKVFSDIALTTACFVQLVQRVKETFDFSVFLIQTCEGDGFLHEVSASTGVPVIPMEIPIASAAKILSNASVFISGRYHPSIMASLGGTPTVLLQSNSHKTISLQYLLEVNDPIEFDIQPNEYEITRIINKAKELLQLGEEERKRIRRRCYELSTESKKQLDHIV